MFRGAKGPTLAECLSRGSDNFLLLRLVAASLVIFGHSYVLGGGPGQEDFLARLRLAPDLYTGSLAVDVFFVVSGFLVTASYVRRDDLEAFLKSRLLRILPGYAVCLIVSAFVLGAIVTERPLGAYLLDPGTRGYVRINLHFDTEMAWTLPGVFTHNPKPGIVNGSIWTLPAEVRVYAWVAVLGFLGLLRTRFRANCALLTLLGIGAVQPHRLPLVSDADILPLAGHFVLGALAYVNRDWIRLHGGVVLALGIATGLCLRTPMFSPLLALTLAYGCLWFAYRPRLVTLDRLGDFSYGVYLWGFPVQQTVAQVMGSHSSPMANFLLSLPLAITFGAVSWHFVERPALRWKRSASVTPTRSSQAAC